MGRAEACLCISTHLATACKDLPACLGYALVEFPAASNHINITSFTVSYSSIAGALPLSAAPQGSRHIQAVPGSYVANTGLHLEQALVGSPKVCLELDAQHKALDSHCGQQFCICSTGPW